MRISLISGGTDATIKIWDLEQGGGNPHDAHTFSPVAVVQRAVPVPPPPPSLTRTPRASTATGVYRPGRHGAYPAPVSLSANATTPSPSAEPGGGGGTSHGHRFGITHLAFFPSDRHAFLSSSYDCSLRLWSTDRAALAGSWDLSGAAGNPSIYHGARSRASVAGGGGGRGASSRPPAAGGPAPGNKLYTFAVAPDARRHLLVACGTQHPAVRLVDLRTASAVQSLVVSAGPGADDHDDSSSASNNNTGTANTGAVLALAWSPRHEHVLAGGSVDGSVRLWDVRRAGRGSVLGMLDMEDAVGLSSLGGGGVGAPTTTTTWRNRASARAHAGPVNGLAWTDADSAGQGGGYIVSCGHDGARVRVWDAASGANTLAAFEPRLRNPARLATVHPVVLGGDLVDPRGAAAAAPRDLLLWPNDNELLLVDLHEGRVRARLRAPGMGVGGGAATATTTAMGAAASSSRDAGQASAGRGRPQRPAHPAARGGVTSVPNRVTALVWRGAGGGGPVVNGPAAGGATGAGAALYTAHLDGQIRAWASRLEGDDREGEGEGRGERDDGDGTDDADADDGGKARKRRALDDAFRSLMGRQITFT